MKQIIKKIKAFSLIELMVVIAIVALLAAVAVPAYKQYLVKSKFAGVMATINDVKSKYIQIVNKYGTFYPFPASANSYDLTEIGYPNSDNIQIQSASDYFSPPLIGRALKDPLSSYGPATPFNNCAGIEMEFDLSNYDNGDAFSVVSGPNVNPSASTMYIQLYLEASGDTVQSVCVYGDSAGTVAADTPDLIPGCILDQGSAGSDALNAMFNNLGC